MHFKTAISKIHFKIAPSYLISKDIKSTVGAYELMPKLYQQKAAGIFYCPVLWFTWLMWLSLFKVNSHMIMQDIPFKRQSSKIKHRETKLMAK